MSEQEVVALHHKGFSVTEIAAKLRMRKNDVWRALRDAGIAKPAHQTRAHLRGEDLADPSRADKGLRKF